MSATTVTSNNSIKAQQRLIQRERERHQRGLQFQDNNVSQVGNPNLTLFSEPIKHEHEDATTKRIKDALGEFTQMKDYIVKNHKQLIGISTSLFRAKDNKANKAKIEQIFSEMKNNIQPLTGLEDNEFPPSINYSNPVQNFQENEFQNNNNLSVNSFGPEKLNDQLCKEQNRIKDIKNVNNNLLKVSNQSNKNYQHSDQEDISLDEVSDENEGQLNGKTLITNNKRNLSLMQENDLQSSKNDSYPDNKKKKKVEDNFSCNDSLKSNVNIVNNDTTHPNIDKIVSKNTVLKKTESKTNHSKAEKEDDDDSSVSSDDSDASSSSSNSSSSDEEENHSENESIPSTAIKDSPNNLNNTVNINNESNLKTLKEESNVNINSSTQAPPPQRSWNLSYIYNKLSNNENTSTINQKSPPVTKAFLKQSLSKDKVENVIDSVVKGSETNEHLFNSESNSSLSSSSSLKLKVENTVKTKKPNIDVSVSKTKRQKTSQSPRSKENKISVKQNDEVTSPKNQKQVKSKELKLEKKIEKAENIEKLNKFSTSSKTNQLKEKDSVEPQNSPVNIKKEIKISSKSKTNQNSKTLPEIPKNLLVSIDLSLLEKKEKKESKSHQTKSSKQFKKEVESTKKTKESESSQNAKDVTIKKESDFKDKYRSVEKLSSKSDKKSKNNKSSVNLKSEKLEKIETDLEKSDKKCKNEENEEFKSSEKIKESSKKKSKEKSKSSSKKVSFEFKEEVKKDKSSKHKKSKKELKKEESTKEEEIKINSTKESLNSEVQNNDKSKDKSEKSKVHKESKHKDSKDNLTEDLASKQDQEKNLLMEGKRLKHIGDREKDLVKQYCKYLEAALYFLQSARCYENKNVDQPEKSFRTYQNTLNFMKSTLQNKFLKTKSQHSEESKLNTLGLRCLSLTMYHMNKIMTKDIRMLEKKINFQLANLTNTPDPNKPDHPLIVGNKIQIPIHLYSLMKRQFDHLNLYNESCELWQQTEQILQNDLVCKEYIEKINKERGLLSLNSNIDDLVPYTIAGLKSLNGDYR